jgi:hypothetical protein
MSAALQPHEQIKSERLINIELISLSLGPQGLKVKADEIRSLIGLSNPEDGDEVIGGVTAAPMREELPEPETPNKTSLNAEQPDSAAAELDTLADDGYITVSDDIAAVIEKAADTAADFNSFRNELQKLVSSWKPDKIAECIAVATFKARALGGAEFDAEV